MSVNLKSNFVAPSEQPERDYVKELEEDYKAWMERWENVGRKFLTSGQSPSRDDETRIARLEKEIEDLKKDKSAKEVIIEEFKNDKSAKDAIIRNLQQRVSKLEASQNPAKRV